MNPTDYLKQKGFSENGGVVMTFEDLKVLLEGYKKSETGSKTLLCPHYFPATNEGYLPCEFCGILPIGKIDYTNSL
ncbi:MAG: hypothetical protein V4608_10890 [Bacteroidota bacterium]